jgi:hypothetical protein
MVRIGTAAFFIARLVSSVIYHVDKDKGKCDLRRKVTGIRQLRSALAPQMGKELD